MDSETLYMHTFIAIVTHYVWDCRTLSTYLEDKRVKFVMETPIVFYIKSLSFKSCKFTYAHQQAISSPRNEREWQGLCVVF